MIKNINKKRNIGKIVRQSIGGLGIFEKVENRFIQKHQNVKYIPPIIIVGPPRTGSTLFYQYLTQYYLSSYISNIASVFYKCPVFITKIFSKKYNRNRSIYNEIGFIDGLLSQSEAAKVFEDWFAKVSYNYNDIDKIRTSVSILSCYFEGPFVAKNMNNSVRLNNILKVFPDALIIHLTRDPLYNAQSILNARKSIYGSFDTWWSTKPIKYDQIVNHPPFEQVVYQVKYINEYIHNTISESDNYINIEYEKFCNNPTIYMNMVSEWYRQKNIHLSKNKEFSSSTLKISNIRKLNDKDWKNLNSAYLRIYDENLTW